MIADEDILELLLDGALSEDEEKSIVARIDRDPAMSERVAVLRSERETRLAVFEALEGDEEFVSRLLNSTRRARWNVRRCVRGAAAVAACLIVFAAGWFANGAIEMRGQNAAAGAQPDFRVAIMDEAGRVLAVQRFDTLEKAREFSEDLRRWQERQEQVVEGRAVVRSASF